PRVLLLVGLLGVLEHWLDGAVLGAAAWVAAAWLEGLVLLPISMRALRLLVAVPAGEPTARGGAERAASLSRRLVLLVVAVCLGQGPEPELNLAAFGVAYALAVLMYSPLRGLHAVGRAGAGGRESLWVAMRFAFRYVLLFAGVSFVVFYSPVDGWLLRVALGLPEGVAARAEPALLLVFLLAILWGYLALFEGIAAALGSPPDTPGNLALRLLAALAVAALAVSFPLMNGAIFAIVALIGAAETQVFGLGWRLFCANVIDPGGSKKPAEPGNGGTTASGGASRAAPTRRQARPAACAESDPASWRHRGRPARPATVLRPASRVPAPRRLAPSPSRPPAGVRGCLRVAQPARPRGNVPPHPACPATRPGAGLRLHLQPPTS
ncbi:MAG: hypothetical protein HY423_13710, partial [Candidatus Lambdaproteobacteria bacterium]|nr:hypothetical protein [Candidatus Lambdaproteobacteria bacterium]